MFSAGWRSHNVVHAMFFGQQEETDPRLDVTKNGKPMSHQESSSVEAADNTNTTGGSSRSLRQEPDSVACHDVATGRSLTTSSSADEGNEEEQQESPTATPTKSNHQMPSSSPASTVSTSISSYCSSSSLFTASPTVESTTNSVKDDDALELFRQFLIDDKRKHHRLKRTVQTRAKNATVTVHLSHPSRVFVTPGNKDDGSSNTDPSQRETSHSGSASENNTQLQPPAESPTTVEATTSFSDDTTCTSTSQGDNNSTDNPTMVALLKDLRKRHRRKQKKRQKQKEQQQRTVRFADEEGRRMETVYDTDENGIRSCQRKRVIVLLLLPKEQMFEYVRVEYSDAGGDGLGGDHEYQGGELQSQHEDAENGIKIKSSSGDHEDSDRVDYTRTPISQLLQQLPNMASDPNMAGAQFVRLLQVVGLGADTNVHSDVEADANEAHNQHTYTELINALSIQSYGFDNDAVLVAVEEGYSNQAIIECCNSLLQNKKLLQAVKKKRWWGRSVLKPVATAHHPNRQLQTGESRLLERAIVT